MRKPSSRELRDPVQFVEPDPKRISDPTQGVGGALSAFFNTLSQLSTNPTDANARQAVLTSANNLANSFHQAVSALNTIGTGLDQSVPRPSIRSTG